MKRPNATWDYSRKKLISRELIYSAYIDSNVFFWKQSKLKVHKGAKTCCVCFRVNETYENAPESIKNKNNCVN